MESQSLQPYMKATAIAAPPTITQLSTEDKLRGNIERADRNIIQSILAQFKKEKSIFSLNTLNSRLVCIFRELSYLKYETLHKIYLLSDKIKVIDVALASKALEVQIHKNAEKKQVLIKRRPNTTEIESCAKQFIEKINVDKSDMRLCLEIVKLLYKWTWGKAACKVEMNLFGDSYNCKIYNLRRVSFQQLKMLSKLSDLITDINIDFKNKWLTFKVTRTNEYITLNELSNRKKQKL